MNKYEYQVQYTVILLDYIYIASGPYKYRYKHELRIIDIHLRTVISRFSMFLSRLKEKGMC